MEERNNKSNTMLLTVIAIATLLVAVIGATFAYFTATVEGNETFSSVIVNGAKLTISFGEDGTNTLKSATEIIPMKKSTNPNDANDTNYFAPIITKTFTLTGENTTGQGNTASPEMRMPYELFLIVTQNNFQLKHTGGHTAITYKLINENNATGSIESNNDFANIGAITAGTGTLPDNSDVLQENTDLLQTVNVYNDVRYDANGLADPVITAKGLKVGQGYFPGSATQMTHRYTLNIYYNETGNNQSFDKDKTFEGYLTISVGDVNTAISSNFNSVNCANGTNATTAYLNGTSGTKACTQNYLYN